MHGLARIAAGLPGWFAFATSTAVQGIGIVLSVIWPWDTDRRFALTSLRWTWGHLNMWLNPIWSMDRRGIEHIGDGPYIVVSNHQSLTDIPCVVGLPLPIRLVARPGIAAVPVMGTFLRLARHVNSDNMLTDGIASLNAGISLLIFPEGTRSDDGTIRRFRGGAFHLAKATGTRILPVVQEGGRFLIPKGDSFPSDWPICVKLQVLEAVDPADFDSPLALRKHVHKAMITAKETL
ncbi:MAG: 1-acyl-sn-glycerol-3-phosphate acyltransferase [Proteobacteria bacterium]|nr:1-acyl-sn-glycerol-3-phosphate acyltransferase [Pseudomonadota bacterium]